MILVTFCLLLPIPPHFTKNLHNNSAVPTSLLRTFIVLVTTSIERSPISTHSQHHEKGQPIKMSGIVHHLVSRGYEEAHDRFKGQPQPISPWKVASLFVTVIVYMLAMFAVRSIPFPIILFVSGCSTDCISRSSTHTATLLPPWPWSKHPWSPHSSSMPHKQMISTLWSLQMTRSRSYQPQCQSLSWSRLNQSLPRFELP